MCNSLPRMPVHSLWIINQWACISAKSSRAWGFVCDGRMNRKETGAPRGMPACPSLGLLFTAWSSSIQIHRQRGFYAHGSGKLCFCVCMLERYVQVVLFFSASGSFSNSYSLYIEEIERWMMHNVALIIHIICIKVYFVTLFFRSCTIKPAFE